MMKKSLIALAAAAVAGGAYATTAVTISGTVDINYGNVDGSGGTTAAHQAFANGLDQQRVAQNGSATSAIVISGSEDIGGGLRGIFRFETNPDFVGGGGIAAGNGWNFVGITGGFGEVRLGRLNSAFLENWLIVNPLGTALGTGFGGAQVLTRYAAGTAPTRFNNAIEYRSPVFSGIQGRLMFVPEDTTPTTTVRPGVIDAGLRFAQGPFAAMLSWQQTDASRAVLAGASPIGVGGGTATTGVDNTLWMLGGRYTMGATAFSAGYFREDVKVAGVESADITGWTLAVAHTMAPWTLRAAYTQSEDKALAANQVFSTTGGALGLERGAKRSVLGLGVDYAFSKRTALYGRFEGRDMDQTEVQTIAVGIRHTF
jgi:predicted porin